MLCLSASMCAPKTNRTRTRVLRNSQPAYGSNSQLATAGRLLPAAWPAGERLRLLLAPSLSLRTYYEPSRRHIGWLPSPSPTAQSCRASSCAEFRAPRLASCSPASSTATSCTFRSKPKRASSSDRRRPEALNASFSAHHDRGLVPSRRTTLKASMVACRNSEEAAAAESHDRAAAVSASARPTRIVTSTAG